MLRVDPIPCLRDNYAYAVVDEARGETVVVDPSEAAPVEAYLRARDLALVGLFATHHHGDHVGGAPDLARPRGLSLAIHEVDAARLGGLGLPVVPLGEGVVRTFAGASIEVVHVPGHTLGAACFVLREHGALPRLFTGDTLFLGGCGRVFEGDPPMLRASLARIASLAPEALVYCGHEYTAANLAFAAEVEPANVLVREALERARASTCTVPGRLSVERASNPFLRTGLHAGEAGAFVVDGRVLVGGGDEVFAALRSAKNVFRAP